MDKEYFLECLADPWIFNSVREFQRDVQEGGINEYDGSGNLLFINKKTLQLERGDYCFRDGLDIWKIAKDEKQYGIPDDTIERIIKHFSDNEKQLVGVLWFNK